MIDRARKFRVGLLVLVCGATFVTLLGFIAGSTLQREVVQYRILFDENVKGMVVGSKVNFQGVPIGAVYDIRFQAGKTLVLIRIDPERSEIQEVTHARLDRLLVTGQVTIELEGYQDGAARLPEDRFIPAASTDPIQELKTSLPSALDKIDVLLTQANTTLKRFDRLLGDDNLARVERTLANLERASDVLPGELRATAAEARRALESMQPLLTTAEASLDRVSETFQRTAVATERVSERLEATLTEGRAAMAQLSGTLRQIEAFAGGFARVATEAEGLLGQNRHALRTVLVGASDALREVQTLARQFRAAPNSVLFGVDEPEITVPAVPPGRGGDR